jgi:hypothetical protein
MCYNYLVIARIILFLQSSILGHETPPLPFPLYIVEGFGREGHTQLGLRIKENPLGASLSSSPLYLPCSLSTHGSSKSCARREYSTR